MVFSGGIPWNPSLCTNGSAGYLMQLSVNGYTYSKCMIAYFLVLQVRWIQYPCILLSRKFDFYKPIIGSCELFNCIMLLAMFPV